MFVPVAVPDCDGEGDPVPVPDCVGNGVPSANTPATRTAVPLRTCAAEPTFTVGTGCPSCVLNLNLACRKLSTKACPITLPSMTTDSAVPTGKLMFTTSTSISRRPVSSSFHVATPFGFEPPPGGVNIANRSTDEATSAETANVHAGIDTQAPSTNAKSAAFQ